MIFHLFIVFWQMYSVSYPQIRYLLRMCSKTAFLQLMWLSTWGTPTIPHQHLLLYHHYNYTHYKIAIDGDSIPHGCHRRQYDFIYSPQYVLNCLSGKLLYGKPRCRAYLVNSERVAEIKVGNPVGWGSTHFGSGGSALPW